MQVAITDVPTCGAVHYARERGIDVHVYPARNAIRDPSERADVTAVLSSEQDLIKHLQSTEIDFVLLAGYLKLVPAAVVGAFQNRMLNIHPGLLPAFGGQGMYGRRVHQAVIKSGSRCAIDCRLLALRRFHLISLLQPNNAHP